MKPCFRALVRQDGILEMLCYEEIGEDFWSGGGITAKSVKQQIDSAGIYSSILLRINSPGGDAFEGVAIGNLLKATGRQVNVVIDGIAASAASIIAMCGNTITMAPNSMMMIHKAWTFALGNADDLRKMSGTLDKIDGAIALTYVDRTGKTVDEITAMMTEETWMSAADCLRDGFCTAISNDDEEDGAAMNLARKFKALDRFQKVPEALNKKAATPECACDCRGCQDGECESCSNLACEDPHCEDCPMQSGKEAAAALNANLRAVASTAATSTVATIAGQDAVQISNLSLFQAKQWMLEKGISQVL
jgi:ATP-dependent protease ClpP protease subunit